MKNANEMKLLSKAEYEASIAATRDERMDWWREARFGMFVHYGLYSLLGRHEWAMAMENYDVAAYEKLADRFCPEPDGAYGCLEVLRFDRFSFIENKEKEEEL